MNSTLALPQNFILRCLGELFGFGITWRRGKVRKVNSTHRLHLPGWLRLDLLEVRVLLLLLKEPRAEKHYGDRSKWGRDQNGEHLYHYLKVLVCFPSPTDLRRLGKMTMLVT